MATVPMLFGTDVRLIPADKVADAKESGGRIAEKMTGPDKSVRWIPASKSPDAVKAGFRPVPLDAPNVSPWRVAWDSLTSPDTAKAAGEELKGAGKGIASLVAAPQGKAETAMQMVPGVLPIYRAAKGELASRGQLTKQASDQFTAGHPVLGSLSTFIAGLPVPGVGAMAAGINESESEGKPEEALGRGIADVGMLAVPEVAGKVVPPILRKGADIIDKGKEGLRKGSQTILGAGDKHVARAVEDEAATRHGEVEKHFDDVHKGEPKTSLETGRAPDAEEQVSRRQAIERGIEKSEPEISDSLKATEDKVNAEANKKYTDLAAQLKDEKAAPYQAKDAEGHVDGEPETITQHLYDVAQGPLRGTETESAIIKSLGKRVENGELELTYNDLQGYREEIGRQLRKGNLEPDTFAAYKALMPEIDNAMQEIANRKGLGKAQTDARNYYRQYAETFLDSDSPVRKAIDIGKSLKREPGQVINALRGKGAALEALARYDPELTKRVNTVGGLQDEASKLPSEKPAKYETPKQLSPKPEIDTRQMREKFIKDKLATWTSVTRFQMARLVAGPAGLLISALTGHPIGEIVGAAYTAGELSPFLVQSMLEKPAFREWLTRPPADELETLQKVPYADRLKITDGLKKTVAAAQAKGVKVSPALLSFIAGASKSPRPTSGPLSQSPIQ